MGKNYQANGLTDTQKRSVSLREIAGKTGAFLDSGVFWDGGERRCSRLLMKHETGSVIEEVQKNKDTPDPSAFFG